MVSCEIVEPELNNPLDIEYNNLKDLKKITNKTAAVILETIQGGAGFILPKNNYLKKVKSRCEKVGALLILDEIQTGFGRTGKLFGFELFNVNPDIIVLGKAMGGGLPIGGFTSSQKLMRKFESNPMLGHITTFGGNPLAMSAGNAVMDVMFKNGFLSNVTKNGKYFLSELNKLKEKYPKIIKEVRGKGLLLGLCLYKDQTNFIKKLMDNKLLTIRAAENVVRILPPLNVKKNELDQALKIINKVCRELN